MADAPALYRVRIYVVSPEGLRSSWVDGPYPEKRQAADKITYWKAQYRANGQGGWSVTGSTEEACMTWRPVLASRMRMCRYARSSGTIPTMPNDMSIGIQNNGMPRSGPQIAASGITQHTGDHSELDDPFVAHRVADRSGEGHGNGDVAEGQPVRAIGNPRIAVVADGEPVLHLVDPCAHGRKEVTGPRTRTMQPLAQHARFPLQRECRYAREQQTCHEQPKPDPDARQALPFAHQRIPPSRVRDHASPFPRVDILIS
jgi:hypothetical protein